MAMKRPESPTDNDPGAEIDGHLMKNTGSHLIYVFLYWVVILELVGPLYNTDQEVRYTYTRSVYTSLSCGGRQ